MLASFDFCITLLLASYIFGCHVVMRLGNCSAHPLILLYHRGAPKERSHIRCDMYPPFLASMSVFYKLVFCLLSFLCDVHSKIVRRWDCKDFLSHKLKKKYVNHQFVIFLIILRHHHSISSFSCIHGKRRPSGNENGHRQSKQWLCWDHSILSTTQTQ